jgi:PTS system mannose-specific IIA component
MTKECSDIAGIVVTHGRLAEELVRTVEGILGKSRDLHSLSAGDLCDSLVIEKIREIISNCDVDKVVLFVDYSGGSCYRNCARATEGVEGISAISGVNLPILLDFMTKRKIMDFDEMVKHLIKRGRESIDYTCF